jgi:hypothetical protein
MAVPKRSLGTRSTTQAFASVFFRGAMGQGERFALLSTDCPDWQRQRESGRADPEVGVPVHGIGDWFWSVFGKPEGREKIGDRR